MPKDMAAREPDRRFEVPSLNAIRIFVAKASIAWLLEQDTIHECVGGTLEQAVCPRGTEAGQKLELPLCRNKLPLPMRLGLLPERVDTQKNDHWGWWVRKEETNDAETGVRRGGRSPI